MHNLPVPVKILRGGLAVNTAVGIILTFIAARRWSDSTLALFCVFIAATITNTMLFLLSIPRNKYNKRIHKHGHAVIPMASVTDAFFAVVFLILHIINVVHVDHWYNRNEVVAMYAAFLSLTARYVITPNIDGHG